jgi:hypothetical protein
MSGKITESRAILVQEPVVERSRVALALGGNIERVRHKEVYRVLIRIGLNQFISNRKYTTWAGANRAAKKIINDGATDD